MGSIINNGVECRMRMDDNELCDMLECNRVYRKQLMGLPGTEEITKEWAKELLKAYSRPPNFTEEYKQDVIKRAKERYVYFDEAMLEPRSVWSTYDVEIMAINRKYREKILGLPGADKIVKRWKGASRTKHERYLRKGSRDSWVGFSDTYKRQIYDGATGEYKMIDEPVLRPWESK